MTGIQDLPRDIGADEARSVDDLDVLRRRMANVVGHALRTPAATIRGHAEILADSDDEATRAAAIDALRRTSRRFEEILDEVLLVEGIDTRLPTGEPTALDPAAEARAVADDLEVVESLDVVGAGQRVLAGRDALRWILRGVLDNAGRYGDGPVRLEVGPVAGAVALRVCTPAGGIGATDDDLRLAFEPFYRGERAVTVAATRLGIGLTSAQRLVGDLGGRLHLERDERDGIVTVLELPRP